MKSFSALIIVGITASITTAILFLAFLLPACYGIDPLGWGAKLGILGSQTTVDHAHTANNTQPSSPNSAQSHGNAAVTPPVAAPLEDDPLSVRTNTVELIVPPKQGLDYRLAMERDYDLDYIWKTNGKSVASELRGESDDGKIRSKTFAKLTSPAGKGFFIIPFNGRFGWHWENSADQPVTIRLTVKGHYKLIGEIGNKPS
jgi:hypothetical protein